MKKLVGTIMISNSDKQEFANQVQGAIDHIQSQGFAVEEIKYAPTTLTKTDTIVYTALVLGSVEVVADTEGNE